MAVMKAKEISKMTASERDKKLNELKLEMVKAQANASKEGGSKIKEIKKMIARIKTINNQGKQEGKIKQ